MQNLFGEPCVFPPPKKKTPIDKIRRNWQERFQRWCNNESQDELTSVGICGYSDLCDYCKDNTFGKPCVRALNALLKEKNVTIDYNNADFNDVWNGKYWRKIK